MAAYAAILSLKQIIEQISHPILVEEEGIQSLKEKVSFLQDFLENYSHRRSSKTLEDLESRIAVAAYTAENTIEFHELDLLQKDRDRESDLLQKGRDKSFFSRLKETYFQLEDRKNKTADAAVDRPNPMDESDSADPSFYKNIYEYALSISDFSQTLQIVIQNMDSICKQSLIIQINQVMKDEPPNSYTPAGLSRSSLPNTIVGFDEAVIQIMDQLTDQQSTRLVIPIVGMGGIGKTTLTKIVYCNPFIVEHFYIRAWVTISQEYSARKILLVLLNETCVEFKGRTNQMSDDQLGEQLYKSLSGMRYLIVMDDIWSVEAWDCVKVFLPENSNGSRVILTTRMLNVADHFGSCNTFQINLLDIKNSWSLLCKKVFGHEGCPPELEEIGMKIAKNCRGLPLSIVVIGGLLSSSKKTPSYWEYVMENVNSIVNSSNDEHGLNILYMSFVYLPIHLKPCFLYMASFPEDCEIMVSRLIRLWVSEGFLKPIEGKSLEEVAEQYLNDLIDRNLLLVHKRGSSGKVKSCKIHDLLRDLCLKEAQKDNFMWFQRVRGDDMSSHVDSERRFSTGIHGSSRDNKYLNEFCSALSSAPLVLSIICGIKYISSFLVGEVRILRVLDTDAGCSNTDIFHLVNSRYLVIHHLTLPSSIYTLSNLQTLIVEYIEGGKQVVVLPSQIWEMTQLRHLKSKNVIMPDPSSTNKITVLENLQTLSMLRNFGCTQAKLGRIPNLKKLGISYDYISEDEGPHKLNLLEKLKTLSIFRNFRNTQAKRERISNVKKLGISYDYISEDVGNTSNHLKNLERQHELNSLENLYHLNKLESLSLACNNLRVGNLAFPCSLKKLTLKGCRIPWKEMTVIGSLPNLEVLKLLFYAADGLEWNPIEGQFSRLKFLMIEQSNLVHWTAENTHFPMLGHLILKCVDLEEIPWGIGDMPTLQLIQLEYCLVSAIESAKLILEERESYGNGGLKVKVRRASNTDPQILACDNFEVQVDYESF